MSKKIIFLNILYGIFFLFVWAGAQQDSLSAKDTGKLNIILANFNDRSLGKELAFLIPMIRETMTDYLIKMRPFSTITIVSHDKLEEVLRNKSIHLSDITKAKEVGEIMKILNADLFITGDIISFNLERRVKEVEKGVIYGGSVPISVKLISAPNSSVFYWKPRKKKQMFRKLNQKRERGYTTPYISGAKEINKIIQYFNNDRVFRRGVKQTRIQNGEIPIKKT